MAHILVIDDEATLRSLLREILHDAGHMVSESSDGTTNSHVWKNPPDLVITDMCLGEASGLDVIRNLRRICPRIRIIAMSGGSKAHGLDILHEATKHGADGTLAKPFKPQAFLAAVNAALETPVRIPPASSNAPRENTGGIPGGTIHSQKCT